MQIQMPGDYRKRPREGGIAGIHSIHQSQSDRLNKNGSLLPKYSIYSIPPNAKKEN